MIYMTFDIINIIPIGGKEDISCTEYRSGIWF